MRGIIDGHSHYMPPEVAANTMFYKVNWSDINRQLDVMDECGISKALLLYPTSDAHIQMGGWQKLCDLYNGKLAEVISKYPNRFIGAGILPLDEPSSVGVELKRIQELGLKVISLPSSHNGKYLDEDFFCDIFGFASVSKLPIHVHSQIMNPIGEERVRDPLLTPVLEYLFDISMCFGKMMMSGTFQNYPSVNFIFAHYGGVLPIIKERFDNTYQMLRGRNLVKDLGHLPSDYIKNIYLDTSGTKSMAAVMCALEMTDSSHIIWGSDYPANQDMLKSVDIFEKMPISAENKKNIFENILLKTL